MLKNSFSFVLASLRGSTYGLGKRLFRQAVGGRVNTVNASPPPLAAASLKGLFEHPVG
jgi:hypothetical protein